MARIAVGGIQHETNVFAPYRAKYEVFDARDEWPPLCRGERMLDEVGGMNLPVSGAIERLRELGHEIVPLLWCSATPSAHVTEDAFERISAMMLETLAASGSVDAVMLDLHGAMVCEHFADGDGELLRRFRAAVGDDVPIAASLDLHANVSEQMLAQASVLEIFRTYPHVDMIETGVRAADLIELLLKHKLARFPASASRRAGFLIPPIWGCTLVDPAGAIYDHLNDQVKGKVMGMSLACGFPLSDVAEAEPLIVAYGFEQAAVDAAADELLAEVVRRESEFTGRLYAIEEAVSEAITLAASADKPVILTDAQDNPGSGGVGETTEILRALIEHDAQQALVGVINDAAAAQAAHRAGIGALVEISLGGKSGFPGNLPLQAEFRVLALSDGCFRATGAMLVGAEMDLGPTALLEIASVRIVVGSKAMQTIDQSMFRHLGVEPARQRIISLKSSVHFRNDFQDICSSVLPVIAPGPASVDLSSVAFSDSRLLKLARKGTDMLADE